MPRRDPRRFILVAESQCRHSQAEQATKTYAEVAEAVARVEQDGLRGVLTGYLVDSLISTGRFEDARACLVLYPTESERFVAMGAIAESEGRRGSAERAREWIARDAPPAYRPALYRRVNSGVLAAIGNSRQSLFSGRDVSRPRQRAVRADAGATAVSRERRAGMQIQRPGKNAAYRSLAVRMPAWTMWMSEARTKSRHPRSRIRSA